MFFKDMNFEISYLEIQFCHAFIFVSAQVYDNHVMFSGNKFELSRKYGSQNCISQFSSLSKILLWVSFIDTGNTEILNTEMHWFHHLFYLVFSSFSPPLYFCLYLIFLSFRMFKRMMKLKITGRQIERWGQQWLAVYLLKSFLWNHRLFENRTVWEL